MSFFSALLVECYSIDLYGYPSGYLMGKPTSPRRIALSGVLLRLTLLPLVVVNWIVGARLRLSKSFTRSCDERIRELIQSQIKRFLRLDSLEGVEFFHLVAHWVREHAPGHGPVLQAHVARKGFLRTLTLLTVITFWLGGGMFAYTGNAEFLALGILSTVAGYLVFLAYLKQERRFTLETLMAFAVAYGERQSRKDAQPHGCTGHATRAGEP